jgi:hypothetical protein
MSLYKVLLNRNSEVIDGDGLGQLVEIVAEASSAAAAWCNEVVWGANGLELRSMRYDEGELSRAGKGIKRWGIDVSGLYQVGSTWRSMEAHTTYVLVDAAERPVLYQDRVEAVHAACAVGLIQIEVEQVWGLLRSWCEARRYHEAATTLAPFVSDAVQREQMLAYCAQAKADEAARMSAQIKMPDLKGSIGQIEWATTLRAEQARLVLAAEEALTTLSHVWPELYAVFSPVYTPVIRMMRAEVEREYASRWWIEQSKSLWGEEGEARRGAKQRLPELLAWAKRGQSPLSEVDARYIEQAERGLASKHAPDLF